MTDFHQALARLNDLEEDLNLSSTEYQTCVRYAFAVPFTATDQLLTALKHSLCRLHSWTNPEQHVLDKVSFRPFTVAVADH
jgi:hypothetical protein